MAATQTEDFQPSRDSILTNMQGYISSSWRDNAKSDLILASSCTSQTATSGEHETVKGSCVLCQQAVTSVQARAKLGNSLYRHHVDQDGKCITASGNQTPVFTPSISVKVIGTCVDCNGPVLNVQGHEGTHDGVHRHRTDTQGKCITELRREVRQQLVLASSLIVKIKGVCEECMQPVTNVQHRERTEHGWRHARDSEGMCISSCPLPPQQQTIRSCSNGIKVKGTCGECGAVVTSTQPRQKSRGGSWQHKQDSQGRCITVLPSHCNVLLPVDRIGIEKAFTPPCKTKPLVNLASTPAPETRAQILSLLQSSPNCVEAAVQDFLYLQLSSQNAQVC